MLGKTAVALLAGLNEAIATDRRFEELLRLIFKAVVHAVMEGEIELVDAARAPMCRSHR